MYGAAQVLSRPRESQGWPAELQPHSEERPDHPTKHQYTGRQCQADI